MPATAPIAASVAWASGTSSATWEGLLAQAAAIVFVLGSYFAAEQLRARRRRAILDEPLAETSS